MERAVQLSEEQLKAWDTLGKERRSAATRARAISNSPRQPRAPPLVPPSRRQRHRPRCSECAARAEGAPLAWRVGCVDAWAQQLLYEVMHAAAQAEPSPSPAALAKFLATEEVRQLVPGLASALADVIWFLGP